ncbi:hypothetical protein CYMTET_4874 [Cymbomonas tetramitiformis]|uniref:Uncharacterized protein n=1 Tax=Cymbomonas tetramitiformis TaxID=36881 RepID=A0AAE0LJY4_9CHLO|nr:hypothetical protein CYMTET_4874 [Cymbomonas tetramitiformis]
MNVVIPAHYVGKTCLLSVTLAPRPPLGRKLHGQPQRAATGFPVNIVRRRKAPVNALGVRAQDGASWEQYEAACQEGNLRSALQALDRLRAEGAFSQRIKPQLDIENCAPRNKLAILNLCASPGSEGMVSDLFNLLREVGLLPSFGVSRSTVQSIRRVAPDELQRSTGLSPSAFSPSKGKSRLLTLSVIAAISLAYSFRLQGFAAGLVLSLASLVTLDSVMAEGYFLGRLLDLVPGRRERVAVHEAGHLVAAYLLGFPIRAVIMDPGQAAAAGLAGTAGTLFWSKSLEEGLRAGQISVEEFNAYNVVIFAGIAAEAIRYGRAEGGGSDVDIYESLAGAFQPPWPRERVSNNARWAVSEAVKLLRDNEVAFNKTWTLLADKESTLADCVCVLEQNIPVKK